jgi:hypothetical protein
MLRGYWLDFFVSVNKVTPFILLRSLLCLGIDRASWDTAAFRNVVAGLVARRDCEFSVGKGVNPCELVGFGNWSWRAAFCFVVHSIVKRLDR